MCLGCDRASEGHLLNSPPFFFYTQEMRIFFSYFFRLLQLGFAKMIQMHRLQISMATPDLRTCNSCLVCMYVCVYSTCTHCIRTTRASVGGCHAEYRYQARMQWNGTWGLGRAECNALRHSCWRERKSLEANAVFFCFVRNVAFRRTLASQPSLKIVASSSSTSRMS